MEILKKLQKARQKIKESKLEKKGYNDFSKYHYYTPEQVNILVNDAIKDLNLFNKYDLVKTELGLEAHLTIFDLDSGEKEMFTMVTEIPEIKATNVTQQLGGAVTYSNRYLLQIVYDIVDNNLDFDAQGNTKKETKPKKEYPEDNKEWLNQKQYDAAIQRIQQNNFPSKENEVHLETKEDFVKMIKSKFKMKKEYWKGFDDELKSEFNNSF